MRWPRWPSMPSQTSNLGWDYGCKIKCNIPTFSPSPAWLLSGVCCKWLRSTHTTKPEGCNLILLLSLKCHSGDSLWQLRSLSRGFFCKNPRLFVGPDTFTKLSAASVPVPDSDGCSTTCLRHLEMSTALFLSL